MSLTAATSIFGVPGTVTIAGRVIAIAPPVPKDSAAVLRAMRDLASKSVTSPLSYVNAHASLLDPAVFAEAIRAAVSIGAGGGMEPNREKIMEQYSSLEGVRWRLWYAGKKLDAGLTKMAVDELVTEENVTEVSESLDAALGLDPKKAPASGTSE